MDHQGYILTSPGTGSYDFPKQAIISLDTLCPTENLSKTNLNLQDLC